MTVTRITVNHSQMGGVPCIRGSRIPVATVVTMSADGMTPQEILEAHPDLKCGASVKPFAMLPRLCVSASFR